MRTEEYKLTVVMETELLGSQTTRQLATEFIAKKNNFDIPEDEIEMLPDALERGTTVFHRDAAGQPVLWDYQCKGFLKEAGRLLSGEDGKPKNLRAKVDSYLFLSPRTIPLMVAPHDGNGRLTCADMIDYLERPLRAQTPQGERIAIARSEMLPAGTWFQCGMTVIQGVREQDRLTEAVIRELLDYGWYKGLLQWRNGGYGRFRYTLERE